MITEKCTETKVYTDKMRELFKMCAAMCIDIYLEKGPTVESAISTLRLIADDLERMNQSKEIS